MNDRQNSKLNMAQRVADTFAKNTVIYEHLRPVRDAVAELTEKISLICEVTTYRISIHIPAVTETKQTAEKEMVDEAMRFSNSLYVIGFTTGNAELTSLSSLSPSLFYKAEDNELMVLFKTSHPDFYGEYRTSRNLINLSGRRRGKTKD